MRHYVVKRLLYLIPTLIGASILIFFLYSLVPGNFIDADPNLTAERKAELSALYGFDQPTFIRYFIWMGNLFQGDLGYSLQFQRPVSEVLGNYIWSSFIVAFASLFFNLGHRGCYRCCISYKTIFLFLMDLLPFSYLRQWQPRPFSLA